MTLTFVPTAVDASASICTDAQHVPTSTVSTGLMPQPQQGLPVAVRGEKEVVLGLRHCGPTPVTVRYECVGPEHLPVIAVLGGISAHRHVTANQEDPTPGWWQDQVGAHGVLDPAQVRVLSIDWLGADGSLDVPLDTTDQADALYVALQELGSPQLLAVVGSSYGAMVGMQMAARYPVTCTRAVLISGGHRAHPFSTAWRTIQRKIIDLVGPEGDQKAALSLARQLALLSYRTHADIASRSAQQALEWLDIRGQEFTERFTPTAFQRLSESTDAHHIDPSRVQAQVAVIAVNDDLLVPLSDLEELVSELPHAELFTMSSTYGHDAFLKEPEQISSLLAQALATVGAITEQNQGRS